MKTKNLIQAFTGGILSEDLFGRTDLAKYATGVADAVNFGVALHGPLVKRRGTRFVGSAISGGTDPILIPFSISNESSAVLEFYPSEELAYIIEDGVYVHTTNGNSLWTFEPSTEPGGSPGVPEDEVLCCIATGSATPPVVTGSLFYLPPDDPELSHLNTENLVLAGRWVRLEFIYSYEITPGAYAHQCRAYEPLGNTPIPLVLDAFSVGHQPEMHPIATLTISPSNGDFVSPYLDFCWAQSYDVLTITNPVTQPIEISRENLSPPVYSVGYASFSTSSALIVTAGSSTPYPSGDLTAARQRYAVTTIDGSGLESLPLRLTGSAHRDLWSMTGTNSSTVGELTVTTGAWPSLFGQPVHGFRVDDRVRLTGLAAPYDIYNLPEGEFYLVKSVPDANRIVLVKEAGAAFDTTVVFGTPTGAATFGAPIGLVKPDATEMDLTAAGNHCFLQWDSIPGAVKYRIYKVRAGVYGFVGESNSSFFRDDNIAPDTSVTPPIDRSTEDLAYPFDYDTELSQYNFPSAVAFWEQRRVFGGSLKYPQTVWMSQTGDYNNFDNHSPVRDDDSIEFTMASFIRCNIRHAVPVGNLLLLTDNGEWMVGTGNGNPVTPSNVSARPQGHNSASAAPPCRLGLDVIYAAAQSNHPVVLAYSDSNQAYTAEDAALFAPSLFSSSSITRLAAARWATPVIFALLADGTLLSAAYSREQQVVAWTRHSFPGAVVKGITVVKESSKDVVYLAMLRTSATFGDQVYMETLSEAVDVSLADARHLDSFLHYSGDATGTLTGLDHLEGESVTVVSSLGDVWWLTVSNGAVTLPESVTAAYVGIPYTARAEMLPVSDAPPVNIVSAAVRVSGTNNLRMGTTADASLYTVPIRQSSDASDVVPLQYAMLNFPLAGSWSEDSRLVVESDEPFPCRILSLNLEVAIGS